MLFHEIYGKYYSCVARILNAAGSAPLSRKQIYELVEKYAFAESGMVIPDALLEGRWQLLEDGQSVLAQPVSVPLTQLQKRWLKTLLADQRVGLFDVSAEGLEDVEPLYDPSVFVWFDRYSDGDPYTDPDYIRHFRALLTAIREGRQVRLRYANQWGKERELLCVPCRMEYSEKDDKFRAISWADGKETTVNIARIRHCTLLEPVQCVRKQPRGLMRTLVLEITDRRNALERAMLHFSNLEKTAEKLDDLHYRLTLQYSGQDETELLIRVLSFGPLVKVVEPESFALQVKTRLQKQNELRTHNS